MISLITLFCMSFVMFNITGFAETNHSHNEISCEVCTGSGKVECSVCGGTGIITPSSPEGSGDDTNAEGTAPTNVEDGTEGEQRLCDACDGTGDATCEACGGTGKTECTGTFEIDPENTTATCYHSGTVAYKCSVCGASYTESNTFLEHDPTEVTVKTPATCTEKGEEECYCEICDETYLRSIPALGHELDENGKCTREGCDYSVSSVGGTFKVDDCWEQYNNKPSFDTFSLTCTVLTAPENGENGTVAVTGWSGAEGNTSSTSLYVLIPETVTDDFGNTYTVTEVTANFQMNQSNQKKGKLLGFYLRAPVKELSVNSMFANQTNLQILQLPDTLEVIGIGCFSGCKKLDYSRQVVLPESLKEIGAGAFKGVPFSGKNKYTLDIPESVTYIGTGAFEKSNLETITGGEGITKLESTVFQDCWLLKSVDFPNVTEFESAVFYNSGLTTVGWDWSKITVLDDDTFGGCYGLTGDLVLSGDCELGWSTFSGTGFSSITIGEGMTEIPNWAFYGCFNLTEINLPNSITTIGQEAFAWPGEGEVTVNIGSDDGSRLSEVKSGAFADGNFNITVHTSEDSISNTAFLESNGNTVTYTVASVETTKTAADLQQQINEAAATEDTADDTIVLTENYNIDATVTIPADSNITIVGMTARSADGGAILKGTVDGYMFSVPENAEFTLGADVNCMVRSSRLIESYGVFNMNGAAVTGGVADMKQGVVHIAGGVFNMNGGNISGAAITNQHSGTVLLSNGAEMTMEGGVISGNTAGDLNTSAGVTVCQGASFTMNGGEISGNKAFRGSGVLVFGGTVSGEYSEEPAVFTMNDGKITGNTASGYLGNLRAAGGGVYVQNNAQFTMNDGEISGNVSDHQGGGVATQDENGAGGVFIMNGGSVTGNSAVNGGGIYSYSRAVKLLAGNIENNTASSLGGGMYVSTNPYSIELGDVLITGNSAEVMGGGIWSCPIGTVDFVNGTFAIYGNSSEKAGDDVAALNKKTNTITTLGDNMPGGGVMAWYKDGSISAVSMDGNDLGAILGDSVRYAEGDIRIEAPVKSEKSFSAKSIVTDDAASLVSASLIIRGNKASQGGGIGSNGIVKQNGESLTPSEITVNKVWSGSGEHPDSVTVELTATKDGKTIVLDRAVLSEDNKWTYTFKYAPLEGTVYGVQEIVPEGYESTVSTDEDTGAVTITNTKKSTPGPDYDYYKVTVNYYDEDGNVIYKQYVSSSIREGGSWDMSARQLETIKVGEDVYTFSYADGDPISGNNIMRDQVINLYYAPGADIDEPDVPLDGGEDIDDPDVPLDGGEDIEDPNVPLGELPHTGTTPFSANKAAAVMMILAAVLTLSGAAAAFAGRRKEQ